MPTDNSPRPNLFAPFVLLRRKDNLQKMVCHGVEIGDASDGVCDEYLVLVIIFDLSNDSDINHVFVGLLLCFLSHGDRRGAIVVIEPLFGFDESGAVFDLECNVGGLFFATADGANDFDVVYGAAVG
eukprot:CAMPEP_0202456166 /NCGR_PEP_ID=MMETSP1360-20130828/13497_1 /ASSEMBLY_ACC=CAM_ASM_000848 /TAXON_ID=515479 /ORGANISM="Licmophora paradoxa, Strain CCMP2313" /LENGTH=126 /DNA_ID=CAMNT_0049075909 /DNA_START=341 /DNA_END=721 /DNA_ORIENTATION=+